MQLRSLKYFCDIAHLGSFTAAAEANHISQSAISQQVKALEAELGATLVTRRGRSSELTAAGAHLAAKAPGILDEIERLQGEVVDIALGNPTFLHIGYLSSYDGWEVAAAIAALKRRHPYAEISAAPGTHEELYERLRQGHADVVFNDRRRDFSDAYVNLSLTSCAVYVEVSEGSPLAESQKVTAQQLRGQTCILMAAPGQERIEAEHCRSVLNLDCDFLFARSLAEARMMVAADRGFLRLESRSEKGPAGGVIRRIPLADAVGQLRRDYYAFFSARDANPLAAEFSEILRGLFQE